MNSYSIDSLLKTRHAWCKNQHGDVGRARIHEAVSKLIAADYVRFEHMRDMLFDLANTVTLEQEEALFAKTEMLPLMSEMERVGLVRANHHGKMGFEPHGRRYLAGGWLEELAYLAALEAGAEEAVYSQVVGWEVHGFKGENEIDIIMRHADKLTFVSCKALKSHLEPSDRKMRNRLMDAVHEADSLAGHFAVRGERVALVVTTELFDEVRKAPRYEALMGKAEALDVRLITLDDLHWDKLVSTFKELMISGENDG